MPFVCFESLEGFSVVGHARNEVSSSAPLPAALATNKPHISDKQEEGISKEKILCYQTRLNDLLVLFVLLGKLVKNALNLILRVKRL